MIRIANLILMLIFSTISFSQTKSIEDLLSKIKIEDSTVSTLISEIKDRKNINKTYALAERFYQLLILKQKVSLIRDTVIIHDTVFITKQKKITLEEFFNRKDSSFFKEIPTAMDEKTPLNLKSKHELHYAVHSLIQITRANNLDTIVNHILEIKRLFDITNNGEGLVAKRQLSEEQKAFLRPLLMRIRDYFDDYFETASKFNPSLLTKAQKKKLLETYVKPIQQTYLNKLRTID